MPGLQHHGGGTGHECPARFPTEDREADNHRRELARPDMAERGGADGGWKTGSQGSQVAARLCQVGRL